MPLPEIAGVVRASLGGSIAGGSRWSNTWHAQRVDLADPTALQIAEVHTALVAFYAAAVMPLCTVATTLARADYTPLDGTSGAFSLPVTLEGGDGTTATLPPEVAEVLTIRTPLRGRRHRGRVFLPALVVTAAPTGRLTGATTTAIVTAAAAAQAALALLGWNMGVASYGKSQIKAPGFSDHRVVESTWPPEFTAVSSFSMDTTLDVIRSRKA